MTINFTMKVGVLQESVTVSGASPIIDTKESELNIRAGASGSDAARYQMDGLSVTGQGTGGETQSYSQEIIAEVEVLTNRYDAEYGRVTAP